LTGGIREGAKGEPPVAYFHSATAGYPPTAPSASLLKPDCSRLRSALPSATGRGRNSLLLLLQILSVQFLSHDL